MDEWTPTQISACTPLTKKLDWRLLRAAAKEKNETEIIVTQDGLISSLLKLKELGFGIGDDPYDFLLYQLDNFNRPWTWWPTGLKGNPNGRNAQRRTGVQAFHQ